jgi:hypothetical protein
MKLSHSLSQAPPYGLFCDYTNTVKAFGLSSPDQSSNPKHLRTLTKFLSLILHDEIPHEFIQYLAYCSFLALHKDANNPDKLRPIGIGTVWRRLAGSVIKLMYTLDLISGFRIGPSTAGNSTTI